MKLIYSILMIYGFTFIIGMFVAAIIWLLYNTMNGEMLERFKHREAYYEMKRMKNKKLKAE